MDVIVRQASMGRKSVTSIGRRSDLQWDALMCV
jgi:hypothetical protein